MVTRGEEVKELWSQSIRYIIYLDFEVIMIYDRTNVAECLNVSATVHIQHQVCGPKLLHI